MSVPSCLVSSASWIEQNILNDSTAPERSFVRRQRHAGGNLGFMSPFVRSPLDFYIVQEDLRGRGYGLRIWDTAIAHAGPPAVDRVVAEGRSRNVGAQGKY